MTASVFKVHAGRILAHRKSLLSCWWYLSVIQIAHWHLLHWWHYSKVTVSAETKTKPESHHFNSAFGLDACPRQGTVLWLSQNGVNQVGMLFMTWCNKYGEGVETTFPTCGTQGHGLLHSVLSVLIPHSHIMLFTLIHFNILTPEG